MTRFMITDPGPAHPAKNAAGPGLPNQTADDYSERIPMLGKWRARVRAVVTGHGARDLTEGLPYDADQLNELLDLLIANDTAMRLRERAHWHRCEAGWTRWLSAVHGVTPDARIGWHLHEAETLDALADQELSATDGGEQQ